MAAESNSGYSHEESLASSLNRHCISFQSGAMNTTSDMVNMGNYFGVSSTTGMIMPGNPRIMNNPAISQAGNSSSSLLLDSVPGLTHDTGLAVEWSVEEQYILDEGLVKFAKEPSILRYIKIAATLRDKTVRDVAFRCRWMTVSTWVICTEVDKVLGVESFFNLWCHYYLYAENGEKKEEKRKRRKQDEHNAGNKVTNRKDKFMESSSKTNLPPAPPLNLNMAAYSLMMHNMEQNAGMIDTLSATARHLLEQNIKVFNQISANFSTYKLEDNIDLFHCSRNNLHAILNDMRTMPGIMSQMPDLPVSIDDDLASSILPSINQLGIATRPANSPTYQNDQTGLLPLASKEIVNILNRSQQCLVHQTGSI